MLGSGDTVPLLSTTISPTARNSIALAYSNKFRLTEYALGQLNCKIGSLTRRQSEYNDRLRAVFGGINERRQGCGES